MPTQFLNDARLLAPQVQMASYAATLAGAQVTRSGASGAGFERPAEAIVNLSRLAKGVGWALAIEGATALSVCGLWYVCHFWL